MRHSQLTNNSCSGALSTERGSIPALENARVSVTRAPKDLVLESVISPKLGCCSIWSAYMCFRLIANIDMGYYPRPSIVLSIHRRQSISILFQSVVFRSSRSPPEGGSSVALKWCRSRLTRHVYSTDTQIAAAWRNWGYIT